MRNGYLAESSVNGQRAALSAFVNDQISRSRISCQTMPALLYFSLTKLGNPLEIRRGRKNDLTRRECSTSLDCSELTAMHYNALLCNGQRFP